jgi:hypothetical protein
MEQAARHQCLIISETLTLINPDYLGPATFTSESGENPEIHSPIESLARQEGG